MNGWDFLISLNETTLIVVLLIALVAMLATVVGVVVAICRITWFVSEFARLPKAGRRDASALLKQLPKVLGR
ncbi:hypothetical protein [Tessaracoccus sp. G1721]